MNKKLYGKSVGGGKVSIVSRWFQSIVMKLTILRVRGGGGESVCGVS